MGIRVARKEVLPKEGNEGGIARNIIVTEKLIILGNNYECKNETGISGNCQRTISKVFNEA
jgi:hypothetical protein